jgi:hypothetical protein
MNGFKQDKYLKLGEDAYMLLNTSNIIREYSPEYDSSYYDSDEYESEKDSYLSSENDFDDDDIYNYDKARFIQEIKEIINQDFKNTSDINNTITQINITKISFNIDYDDFENLIYVILLDMIKNNNIKLFYNFITPIIYEFIKNELYLTDLVKHYDNK